MSKINAKRAVEVRKRVAKLGASKLRKFTDVEVGVIRKLYATGESLKRIAERYHVSKSTISYIVNYKTYAPIF